MSQDRPPCKRLPLAELAPGSAIHSVSRMNPMLAGLLALPALLAASAGTGALLHSRGCWSARVAAGCLFLSGVTALLGWMGLLYPAALWSVLAAGVATFPAAVRRPAPLHWKAAATALVLLLLPALLPQSARDAMNHHLYLPRLWLETGTIHRPGWAGFFSYPYMVESLYALAGGTFGLRCTGVVSLLGLLAALGVLEGSTPGPRRAGLLAAAAWLAAPEVFRNATWAYSDSFLYLYALLGFLESTSPEPRPWLAGLWAGAAGACKYNGLAASAVILTILAVRPGRRAERAAAGAAVFTAVTLAWALPNLIQWGNPVYPLARSLLGPPDTLSSRSRELISAYADYTSAMERPLDILSLPVGISLFGRWDEPRLFDGASGPLLLAGAAAFALAGRRRVRLTAPILVSLLVTLIGFPAVRVRYLFPGLVMAAPLAGEGLSSIMDRGRPARIVALLVIAASIGWSGSWLVRLYSETEPWRGASRDYLVNRLPYMSFYMSADSVLEPSDTTLFVNMGNRAFYFPSYVIYDDRRFPLVVLDRLWRGCTAEELAEAVRRTGAEYLAMDMEISQINIVGELEDSGLAEWRRFLSRMTEPVVTKGDYVLFRLLD